MTNFAYNNNIPNGPNNPSADQPGMQVNTNSISGLIAVNHNGFGLNDGGKHSFIQMPTDLNPGGVTGSSEILLYNGLDTFYNLFFIPPSSAVPSAGIQLTRNEAPVNNINGFSWLPGGIFIQWGIVAFSGPASSQKLGSVLFGRTFTTFCNITTGLITADITSGNTTASNTLSVQQNGSLNGFAYVFNSSSGSGSTTFPGFYWHVIGK